MTPPINIVITGASRGIGYATARAFAEREDTVIVAIARSEAGLADLSDECGHLPGKVMVLRHDISADPSKLGKLVSERIPRVDILVNNAGLMVFKPFMEFSAADLDELYNVNLKAHFLLTQALVPLMVKGSHIVNISSMGGVQGSVKFAGLSAYSSMKGAIAVLTETLALELKPLGISVNCIAPGSVQTEMLAQAFPGYSAPVQPEQMGSFLADFAIRGSKFFNGKILPVSVSTP